MSDDFEAGFESGRDLRAEQFAKLAKELADVRDTLIDLRELLEWLQSDKVPVRINIRSGVCYVSAKFPEGYKLVSKDRDILKALSRAREKINGM